MKSCNLSLPLARHYVSLSDPVGGIPWTCATRPPPTLPSLHVTRTRIKRRQAICIMNKIDLRETRKNRGTFLYNMAGTLDPSMIARACKFPEPRYNRLDAVHQRNRPAVQCLLPRFRARPVSYLQSATFGSMYLALTGSRRLTTPLIVSLIRPDDMVPAGSSEGVLLLGVVRCNR